jgi:hypothetical protein
VQLRDEAESRRRVDPAETPQPRHRARVGFRLRPRGELRVEYAQPHFDLVEREVVIVEGSLVGRVLEPQPPKPLGVGVGPRLAASAEHEPAAQQELREPMA